MREEEASSKDRMRMMQRLNEEIEWTLYILSG